MRSRKLSSLEVRVKVKWRSARGHPEGGRLLATPGRPPLALTSVGRWGHGPWASADTPSPSSRPMERVTGEPRSHWRKGSEHAPVSPAVTSPFTANFRTARLQCVHLARIYLHRLYILRRRHIHPQGAPSRLGNGLGAEGPRLGLSGPCSPGTRGWEPTPRLAPRLCVGRSVSNGTSDLCVWLVPVVCGCENQWLLFCAGNGEREGGPVADGKSRTSRPEKH